MTRSANVTHRLFPMFMRLEGLEVLVVGAGKVAERKVASLLSTGAMVKVVAPDIGEPIADLADKGDVAVIERCFAPEDLDGVALAFCATDDPTVSERVSREAMARSVPVNVVDVPDLCSFFVPSVLTRGALQIAVSTSGAAPSVARDIRLSLEDGFEAWWEDCMDELALMRTLAKRALPDAPSAERSSLMEAAAGSLSPRTRQDRRYLRTMPCAS